MCAPDGTHPGQTVGSTILIILSLPVIQVGSRSFCPLGQLLHFKALKRASFFNFLFLSRRNTKLTSAVTPPKFSTGRALASVNFFWVFWHTPRHKASNSMSCVCYDMPFCEDHCCSQTERQEIKY